MQTVDQLLSNYPIISDQVELDELRVILNELQQALSQNPAGDVVEFGCYIGTTSLFMQRILMQDDSRRTLHVYDSFAGLPSKTDADESPAGQQFQLGKLAVSKGNFIQAFKRANIPLPVIHKGWFDDLTDADIPEHITFAFLDGDYYRSVQQSLRLIESRLTSQAIIVIDDYQSEALPGAAKAVDEWRQNRKHRLRVQSSLAILHMID